MPLIKQTNHYNALHAMKEKDMFESEIKEVLIYLFEDNQLEVMFS